MTLYSQKALSFKNGGEMFILKHLAITPDAPEWIKETDTYKHAIEDGCLMVIDNKEKKIAAENGDLAKPGSRKKSTNEN